MPYIVHVLPGLDDGIRVAVLLTLILMSAELPVGGAAGVGADGAGAAQDGAPPRARALRRSVQL